MDLPGLFATTPEVPEKLYIAIVLTEQSVQSALWKVVNGEIVTIKRSELHTYQAEKECLVKTDECLQELGKESENVSQVVFGLQPSWVIESDVSPAKQKLLDKITTDLSLEAVGFVVITEAVIRHLLHTHPNTSALYLHISAELLSVTLVLQGKPAQSEHVGRSTDIVADVTEALARIQSRVQPPQPFPAKFFVYSGDLTQEQLISEEQLLIDQDWLDRGFLQPPVTEVLSPALILEAVVNQGGIVVAAVESTADTTSSPALPVPEPNFDFNEVSFAGETANSTPTADETANVVVPDEEKAVPFGSTFGVPVTAHSISGMTPVSAVEDADLSTEAAVKKPKFAFKLPTLKLPKFGVGTKNLGLKHAPHPFIAVGFGLGLLVLIVAGYLYLKLTTTVVIAIELATKNIAKEAEITLNPQATSTDAEKLILPATLTSKEFTASATVPASGVTLVGEKAKGKVSLFNKTTSPKTFAAGTTVTSGKYQFALDEEVTVASASVTVSGSSETKNYGKGETNVTATVIGAENNLGKDTELTIASFDPGTYSAAVTEGLSGGSSREVRVVSEEDRSKLLSQLKAEILKQADTDFNTESGNGSFTLPTGNMKLTETTYSAKAGDAVEELSLSLKAEVEAMKYTLEDLMPLAEAILISEVPSGYELTGNAPDVMSTPVEQASSSALLKLNVNLSSQAKPKVIADNWKNEIAGMGLESAISKLKGKSEIRDVSISFKPSIVYRLIPTLPAADRITIETK